MSIAIPQVFTDLMLPVPVREHLVTREPIFFDFAFPTDEQETLTPINMVEETRKAIQETFIEPTKAFFQEISDALIRVGHIARDLIVVVIIGIGVFAVLYVARTVRAIQHA